MGSFLCVTFYVEKIRVLTIQLCGILQLVKTRKGILLPSFPPHFLLFLFCAFEFGYFCSPLFMPVDAIYRCLQDQSPSLTVIYSIPTKLSVYIPTKFTDYIFYVDSFYEKQCVPFGEKNVVKSNKRRIF